MSSVISIVSQMRRSVISIPANIAEGAGRGARKKFVRFLNIARGSATESDTLFLISSRLCYISVAKEQVLATGLEEIRRMLSGLARSLA